MPSQQNIGPQPIAGDVTPADLISADADNALVEGTDDKLFVPESSGGITNSAPANTIPLSDGTNLVDSKITWNGEAGIGGTLAIVGGENGAVGIEATGLGAQLNIRAADGDADHVGGEVTINSGAGDGGNFSGDLTISTGSALGEGDSGAMALQTGAASDGADGGGSTGNIDIKAGSGTVADSSGGSVNIGAGQGRTGGGSIILNAGARTVSGSHGTVQIYSADTNNSIDLSNTALTQTAPIIDLTATTSINLGTPKVQVNATVTAPGTTGVQTIDKAAGSVNFALGESSKQVNNSTVTPDSIILATVATNDASAVLKNVVAGNGSFVITLNAATGAETRVNFWVLTPQ